MSLRIVSSRTYSGMQLDEYAAAAKEFVQMICDSTPTTLHRVDIDEDANYAAIMHVGGNDYFRISATESGNNAMSYGYMDGSDFVPTTTVSGTAEVFSGSIRNYVYVVNDGEAWDAGICLFSGLYNNTNWRIGHFRVVKIRSSLTGSVVRSCGVCRRNTQGPPSFPAGHDGTHKGDYIRAEGTNFIVFSTDPPSTISGSIKNVPAGKMLLFPSLISIASYIDLGVPTIGRQKTFYLSGPGAENVQPFTEITINNVKYVSLGNIVIRSL